MRATIREATTADAAAIAETHAATWRETYRALLPDSYLDGLTPAGREPQWRRILALPAEERSVLVATVATGALAGFASGDPARGRSGYVGEVYILYLRRECRGCGLGRALSVALAASLTRAGERIAHPLGSDDERASARLLRGDGWTEAARGGVRLARHAADRTVPGRRR